MPEGSFADGLLSSRRILVVSPHPDDESFGCGGTIAKAKAMGSQVFVMLASAPRHLEHFNRANPESGKETRWREFEEAMTVLGVDEHCVLLDDDSSHMRLDVVPRIELVRRIERDSALAIERVRPELLLFPARSYNQDHDAVFGAVMAACRPHLRADKAFVPAVWIYDQPQLCWAEEPFHPNLYVDISDFLEVKLRACACHRSQLRPDPHHGSLANIERLARLRGSDVSVAAAEAFRCLRLVA